MTSCFSERKRSIPTRSLLHGENNNVTQDIRWKHSDFEQFFFESDEVGAIAGLDRTDERDREVF